MGWWPCQGCDDICTYDASDGTQYADTFGGSLDGGWGATAGVTWLIDTGRLYIPPFVALERVLYRTIELDCELDEFIFEVDVYDNTAGQWGLIVLDNTFTPLTVRFRLYCSFGSTTYSYLGPTGNGSVQGTAPSDGDKLSIKIKRTSTGQYTVCFYHEEALLAQQSGAWTSPSTFYPGIQIFTIGGFGNKGSFDDYTSELHLLPCVAQEAPAATQSATGTVSDTTIAGTVAQTEAPATQLAAGAVLVSGAIVQTAPVATQALNGVSTITGTITQIEAVAIQSAAGAVLLAGTAVQVETVATQLAVGGVLVAGTIIQTCPVATQAASGIGTVTGTITQTGAAATQTAAGAVAISGTAAQTCPSATQAAAGGVAIAGTISQTGPTSTQSATGTVSSAPITGTAAQTAPTATQSLAGFVLISGSASQTAAVAVQSLIGGVQISGSIAMTEAPATQTASGGVEVAGTITQTCPVETQSASGTVVTDGNIAQTCPPEEQTLSGATCSNFDCVYTCQAGGGAWTVTEDNCFATSCVCGPGPPDEECLEGVNEGEERNVDCAEL